MRCQKFKLHFDINADGILNVTAKDLDTLKEQKIKITGNNKTTKEEIERARKTAEEFETITRRKKEEAEIKNEARDLINKVTRWIKVELTGKVKREQLIAQILPRSSMTQSIARMCRILKARLKD